MSEPQRESAGGWVGWLWRQPRNSLAKTLLVPALVSLVCAVLVAGSAMMLRPQQRANEERNRQENILAAAGLLESGGDVARRFADIEARVIDLAAGDFAPDLDAASISCRRSKCPEKLERSSWTVCASPMAAKMVGNKSILEPSSAGRKHPI